ncbi:hypothetical protein [Aminobacter sp. MET-1]|uniref:hypothetical protein n=1 Tax=Aminobacter sp. MET-1 TaxID=2951085 RepID=UPI00226A8A9A|nr:hypothetical protein [Aminobacter sp. MET-1]MCX8571182.1 hypothetical protein [Aminobacter sp. MET-1]MCX8573320.1 hypothetical protein [Aminobacter sp. MET-1]
MKPTHYNYDRDRFQRILLALKSAGSGFGQIAREIGTPYHIVVMNARGDIYSKRIVNAIASHLPPAEAALLPSRPTKSQSKS